MKMDEESQAALHEAAEAAARAQREEEETVKKAIAEAKRVSESPL